MRSIVFSVLAAGVLLLCALSGCGRDQGLDFFGIGADADFPAAQAALAERGFRFEGREGEPFLFIGSDFEEYYTFAGQTRLLAALKKDFAALVAKAEGYEYFEPRYVNSYIFQPPGGGEEAADGPDQIAGGEVGVGFSALSGEPLYIYYFTDDIRPLLAEYQKRMPEAEQVFPATGAAGLDYHYFETETQLLLLEKDPGGDSGGAICYFADHVEAFYKAMQTELNRYGAMQ